MDGGTGSARWRLLALGLLVGAAACNGCTVEAAGRTVYPEYLALAALLPIVIAAMASRTLAWRWPVAVWPLLVWLAVALAASLLNAPRPATAAVLWVKLAMMVAIFAVTANLARGVTERAAALQCAVAALLAGVALAAALSWRLLGTTLLTQASPAGGRLPLGTLLETNLLGSYLLAAALLAGGLLGTRREIAPATRRAALAAVALGLLGLVASVTRAAWLGLAAALGVAALAWAWRRSRVAGAAVLLAELAALLLAGALVADRLAGGWRPRPDGPTSATVGGRISSLGEIERDGNLWVRVQVVRSALAAWRDHRWIGHGVGAYGDLADYPTERRPAWIPNFFVHHLFDSGLAGLAALFAGVGAVLVRGVKTWRWATGARRGILGGLLLAFVALAVAFQTTEASWLAYPWILLGLLEAAAAPAGEATSRD